MAWVTNGKLANPGSGTVLADTGALSNGTVSGTLIVWADTPVSITLHRRNATNTGDVAAQEFYFDEHNLSFVSPIISITVAANERITVTLDNAITGNVQASLIS